MSRSCGSSKPTATPLNGSVMKRGKTRRKLIEDTIIRQPTVKNLPRTASVAGGRDEKCAMMRQTTVKNLPRAAPAGGGKTKKCNLKENAGATTRETNVKTPSAGRHRGRGSRRKGENQHEMERWHNPQSREEGTRLVENVWERENKIACITKKIRQKHTVLFHGKSSQITLAASRLGAEEGVGRTEKRSEYELSLIHI